VNYINCLLRQPTEGIKALVEHLFENNTEINEKLAFLKLAQSCSQRGSKKTPLNKKKNKRSLVLY